MSRKAVSTPVVEALSKDGSSVLAGRCYVTESCFFICDAVFPVARWVWPWHLVSDRLYGLRSRSSTPRVSWNITWRRVFTVQRLNDYERRKYHTDSECSYMIFMFSYVDVKETLFYIRSVIKLYWNYSVRGLGKCVKPSEFEAPEVRIDPLIINVTNDEYLFITTLIKNSIV